MDRLTKRIGGYAHGAEGITQNSLTGNYCRGEFESTACIDKLAEYEDLEEQCKLLKLPCALGDTVYVIELDEENFTQLHAPRKISEYEFTLEMVALIGLFGKCIFLTREEAESALESQKDKNK